MCGTREYIAWQHMKARCENPRNKDYPNYGARGICVCKRWRTFENFYYDMGPANGMTIDRIDFNGNYEPSNCRWVPMSEQAKNTRKVRYIEYDGNRMTVADWARKLGVKPHTISMRLNSYGWPVEKALSKGAGK